MGSPGCSSFTKGPMAPFCAMSTCRQRPPSLVRQTGHVAQVQGVPSRGPGAPSAASSKHHCGRPVVTQEREHVASNTSRRPRGEQYESKVGALSGAPLNARHARRTTRAAPRALQHPPPGSHTSKQRGATWERESRAMVCSSMAAYAFWSASAHKTLTASVTDARFTDAVAPRPHRRATRRRSEQPSPTCIATPLPGC
jgi:hypothetical protein